MASSEAAAFGAQTTPRGGQANAGGAMRRKDSLHSTVSAFTPVSRHISREHRPPEAARARGPVPQRQQQQQQQHRQGDEQPPGIPTPFSQSPHGQTPDAHTPRQHRPPEAPREPSTVPPPSRSDRVPPRGPSTPKSALAATNKTPPSASSWEASPRREYAQADRRANTPGPRSQSEYAQDRRATAWPGRCAEVSPYGEYTPSSPPQRVNGGAAKEPPSLSTWVTEQRSPSRAGCSLSPPAAGFSAPPADERNVSPVRAAGAAAAARLAETARSEETRGFGKKERRRRRRRRVQQEQRQQRDEAAAVAVAASQAAAVPWHGMGPVRGDLWLSRQSPLPTGPLSMAERRLLGQARYR